MNPSSTPKPPANPQRDRLLELLADQAVFGLSPEEAAELESLREVDRSLDPLEFERAAAALHLAQVEHAAMALPEELRQRVSVRGAEWARQARKWNWGRSSSGVASQADQSAHRPRAGRLARLGWLAAAACLALAIWGWWPRVADSMLLAWRVDHAPDRMTVNWGPGNHGSGQSANGTVNWSHDLQRGYVRVNGLQPNDPAKSQYQLWIKVPNQKQPIDAGVFDIADSSGEVIIPIHAKLPVNDKPELFAITVEQPGGVVVSDLERIALAASPTK